MNDLFRINLIGQHKHWWCTSIAFAEIKLLRAGIKAHLEDRFVQETASNIHRYSLFINELRKSTMLEF